MSISFHVAVLTDNEVSLALPLIQATWPHTDMVAWQSFAAPFLDRGEANSCGILVLRDRDGHMCGILAYRLDRNLGAGPILAVQLFSAVDLANSLSTVRALVEAAEMRALELGCTGIQIRLDNAQPALASRLRTLGLSPAAGLFWKHADASMTRN